MRSQYVTINDIDTSQIDKYLTLIEQKTIGPRLEEMKWQQLSDCIRSEDNRYMEWYVVQVSP